MCVFQHVQQLNYVIKAYWLCVSPCRDIVGILYRACNNKLVRHSFVFVDSVHPAHIIHVVLLLPLLLS